MASALSAEQRKLRADCFNKGLTRKQASIVCDCSLRAWDQWEKYYVIKLAGDETDKRFKPKPTPIVALKAEDVPRYYKHNINEPPETNRPSLVKIIIGANAKQLPPPIASLTDRVLVAKKCERKRAQYASSVQYAQQFVLCQECEK
jgi:hypothetical protein